ncbi:MAG: FecR family protein [Chitinophagaceae bacterium]|nr:FecR family protein [Chitinophagaceae bacterium]
MLKRYRLGNCTDEEKKIVDAWYESIRSGIDPQMSISEEETLEKKYWHTIQTHIRHGEKTGRLPVGIPQRRIIPVWPVLRIAAVVLLVFTILVLFQSRRGDPPVIASHSSAAHPEMNYVMNEGKTAKQVVLPDGSKVALAQGSRISYAQSFNLVQRDIYLQGEAFFNVRPDNHRPFLVHSDEVVTRVLGTSFTVTARPGEKNIIVAVHTGKVSVVTPRKQSDILKTDSETILTPNQQMVYNRSAFTSSKSLVKVPQPVLSTDEIKRVRFEEAPVADIFEALEKMYSVHIAFDEKIFRKCVLTTSISDGDIFSRIDIICKAINATYTVQNATIVIDGSGCN